MIGRLILFRQVRFKYLIRGVRLKSRYFKKIQLSAPCEAGKYITPGNKTCVSCEGNSFSSEGASSCTTCDPGTVANYDKTQCGEKRLFKFCLHFSALDKDSTHESGHQSSIHALILGYNSKVTPSVFCQDGMYRSESMKNCEDCAEGKETNAEKSECGA